MRKMSKSIKNDPNHPSLLSAEAGIMVFPWLGSRWHHICVCVPREKKLRQHPSSSALAHKSRFGKIGPERWAAFGTTKNSFERPSRITKGVSGILLDKEHPGDSQVLPSRRASMSAEQIVEDGKSAVPKYRKESTKSKRHPKSPLAPIG